jgi:hypothetical protein
MTTFSGWGPTDDGRIKPDVVANGVSLWSCSDGSDTSHAWSSGTSMSSPGAAASTDLLVDHWRELHGSDPRAATLKALILHTADECGDADGPDYRFGWGLLNTRAAALLLSEDAADSAGSRVLERELADAQAHAYDLALADSVAVRFTLSWTDVPGTPPPAGLDPPDAMLVNDLDLRLTDGTTVWEPWVLDPASPDLAAARGDNARDNAEQVFAASLPAGAYTLWVTHKGTLSGGAQAYSLVASHAVTEAAGPVAAGLSPGADERARVAPNPFSARTTISFRLPARAPVSAAVWDVGGRLVRTLADGAPRDAGEHRLAWDGRRDDGRPAAPGVYFARLSTRPRTSVHKLVRR